MLQSHRPRLEHNTALRLGVLDAIEPHVRFDQLMLSHIDDLDHEVYVPIHLGDDSLVAEANRSGAPLRPGQSRVYQSNYHRIQQGLPQRSTGQDHHTRFAVVEVRIWHAIANGLDRLNRQIKRPEEGVRLQAAVVRHHAEHDRKDHPTEEDNDRGDEKHLPRRQVDNRMECGLPPSRRSQAVPSSPNHHAPATVSQDLVPVHNSVRPRSVWVHCPSPGDVPQRAHRAGQVVELRPALRLHLREHAHAAEVEPVAPGLLQTHGLRARQELIAHLAALGPEPRRGRPPGELSGARATRHLQEGTGEGV
mmetsp:Transcript_80840/g.210611  ORF Transcript_80840/g.210611 Transcript_80840/m.210611 type:complete len:306 (+) Transcript_80840:594-1511(+)